MSYSYTPERSRLINCAVCDKEVRVRGLHGHVRMSHPEYDPAEAVIASKKLEQPTVLGAEVPLADTATTELPKEEKNPALNKLACRSCGSEELKLNYNEVMVVFSYVYCASCGTKCDYAMPNYLPAN